MPTNWLRCLALMLLPVWAVAQTTYPTRPIQMLIPYPAGGTTDVMARALQEPLQKALGQTVIVENKAGASGVLAAREVARARPDGHSLLFIDSGIVAVTPHVQKDAGFHDVKDFAPVAMVTAAPLFVIVPGSLPVTDLKSWIEWAKKQPGPLPFASAGVGSFGHLASELFAKAAGLKMTHVPYRGQAPTTIAVVAGEVPLLITSMSGAMRDAITGWPARAAGRDLGASQRPEPRRADGGERAARLRRRDLVRHHHHGRHPARRGGAPEQGDHTILATKDIQDRMTALGQEVQTMTPAQLGTLIADDSARWGQVVRDNNVRAE